MLFRYFLTKQELIECVYEYIYIRTWNPDWEILLQDGSMTLRERLQKFYSSNHAVIFKYEWIRIFFFSALRDTGLKNRYLRLVKEKIVRNICIELRKELALPSAVEIPIEEGEMDLVWSLQGQVLFTAVRRFIYGEMLDERIRSIIENEIQTFMGGAASIVPAIVAHAQQRDAQNCR